MNSAPPPFDYTPPTSMADWSQLPPELLNLISNRLNSDLYRLRFRSVCSTWRSSIPIPNPNHHLQNLPSKLPLLSNSINHPYSKSTTFSLSKRTFFLIFPPPQNQTLHHHHHHHHHHHPWLIKINNTNNQLLNPLSRYSLLRHYFPHVLDFNDLSVVELGHEFVLGDAVEFSSLPPAFSFNNLFLEKVVVIEIERCFVLLTIHISGKLAVFRSGDDRWTIISEMPMPYDDVCVFKGNMIAVDGSGRTVRVSVGVGIEPEVGLDLVAEPIFGGDKKYLVESNGELLLVDKHLSCVCYCSALDDDYEEDDNGVVVVGDDYGVGWERVVKFDVYKLDEKEKRWVELTNLRDRILFLGDDCAFSVSASDLGFGNGNCVIFRDDAFNKFEFETGVFDLDLQKISPLHKDYSSYFDLFWPPEWVRSQ